MSREQNRHFQIVRFLQPAGFALMLAFFILARLPWAFLALWMGAALTLAGTWTEIRNFIKTPEGKRSQAGWVFIFGIITKLLLIAAIILRIYDTSYSLFILLGCIVLAMIWLILSQVIKPLRSGNADLLDSE